MTATSSSAPSRRFGTAWAIAKRSRKAPAGPHMRIDANAVAVDGWEAHRDAQARLWHLLLGHFPLPICPLAPVISSMFSRPGSRACLECADRRGLRAPPVLLRVR